jgi:hypothetical protein
MWNYYLYNPDTSYLSQKIYPVLKDYATFYASFMEKCQVDGTSKTIFGPSYDPEHGSWGIDNSPFDIAYAKYCMTAAVKAATILGRDATLVQRWNTNLAKLPYYPTAVDGASGQTIVQNWRGCTVGTVTSYNIPSPTTPLFPADQVSWFSPASEKSLFQRTITWIGTRVNRNNSNVMLNVARARLSMTSEAINDTKAWFTGKQQPNGLFYWQGHGYFIFEAVAVASLISEFLMQSVNDTIRIFPAWATATDAKFTDLRAQGGFLISSQQAAGSIPSFRAISTAGGQFGFVSPWTGQVSARFSNGTARILTPNASGTATLATTKGDTIIFTPSTAVHASQIEANNGSLRIIAGKTLFLNVTAVGMHHIAVFGLDGRMRAVFNGRGNRTYRWNPSAPGVYVVRMQTKQGTLSRKVLLGR